MPGQPSRRTDRRARRSAADRLRACTANGSWRGPRCRRSAQHVLDQLCRLVRTCSQLSRTSSVRSWRRTSDNRRRSSSSTRPSMSSAATTTAATVGAAGKPSSREVAAVKSHNTTPSGKAVASRWALSNASRVLPTPPGPISVTSLPVPMRSSTSPITSHDAAAAPPTAVADHRFIPRPHRKPEAGQAQRSWSRDANLSSIRFTPQCHRWRSARFAPLAILSSWPLPLYAQQTGAPPATPAPTVPQETPRDHVRAASRHRGCTSERWRDPPVIATLEGRPPVWRRAQCAVVERRDHERRRTTQTH